MKRTITVFAAACFFLIGASLVEAATIKIATIAPDGSAWMKEMRRAAEAVKQRTQGQLEIKFYPGGVMGSDATVVKKIKLGQLQGGAFSGAELSPVLPDAQIYSLPFLFRDQREVDYVRGKLDARLKADFEKQGMKILGMCGGGFAYLMSTRSIQNRDDLKKSKVWVPQADKIAQVTFEAGNVTPIALPLADVFTALSTGMIETVGNTPSGTIAFQWHTKIKYLIDFPLTYIMGMLAVDKKIFDRLDPVQQAVLLEEFDKSFAKIDAQTRQDNAAAYEALTKQGVQVIKPNAEERAFWVSTGEKAREQLAKEKAYTPELYAELLIALEAARKSAQAAK